MQRIYTERAHLMCPNMCFGIVMAVNRPYDETSIRDAVKRLAAAHPFLNALLGYAEAENAYYYRATDRPQVELRLKGGRHDAPESALAAPGIMKEYHQLTGRDWDLFEEGMLKISVWQAGTMTQFLLVFHHLLADGRGALGLAEELAECYVRGLEPKSAPETLISSVQDFPPDSRLPLISRMLVSKANRDWEKERHCVTYADYHAFANEFLRSDRVRHSIFRIGQEKLDRIRQKCHEEQVTVNDYLIAKMMQEEKTRKVIIASDLRSRLSCYREGALGNYSTAFSVEVKKVFATRNLFSLARAVHDQVVRIMARPEDLYLVLQCYTELDPGLLDAAFISCKGGFPSKAGKFIGSLFFGFEAGNGYSITNLGAIESGSIAEAYFIPPASPAIRKTQGILTVNGVMTICTSER